MKQISLENAMVSLDAIGVANPLCVHMACFKPAEFPLQKGDYGLEDALVLFVAIPAIAINYSC